MMTEDLYQRQMGCRMCCAAGRNSIGGVGHEKQKGYGYEGLQER
jgi:hypothetical protein